MRCGQDVIMPTPEQISDEDVRLAVYTKFAREGAAPTDGELAAQLAITQDDVRAALVRLARAPDDGILVSRTAPGRGAWLCAGSVSCLDRAVKRDALRRALRGPVAPSGVAALRDSFVGPPQNMEESSAAGYAPGTRKDARTRKG